MFLTGNNLGVRCKEKSLTGRIQEALGMVLRALGSGGVHPVELCPADHPSTAYILLSCPQSLPSNEPTREGGNH